MLGSLTKAIANFLESTDIVQQYNIPVYTANTAEDKFTVNTSLPAIIITVSPSDDPTVFISGNILDSFIINIRYLNDLLNYSFSDDNGIYEEMRDIPVKLRNELWDNRKSSYFKEFMNNLGLNIMYKGMSTYAHEAVYDNISKDLDIFSFTFSCNLFADLEYVENAILNSFNIVLDGMTYPDPNPPVSGIADGSGRIFPIWNTVSGGEIYYLSIHGGSIQNGTPTPENPVPILSCGDQGLSLILSDQQTGGEQNTLNISQAMQNAGHDGILRSVNGIYDEIVYDGKSWKLIQRIKEYSVDDLSAPGNYSLKKFESGDNVQYAIYYKTPQDDLVSDVNSLFMSDYSDKHFWPGVTYKGVGYYFGNLCFSMLNGETTETEALNITKGKHYQGLLTTPIEYSLDLPQISTYEEQTYFATNAMNVKPRMVAQCQVSEKLDYIKEGLLGYWTGRERSNTDENRDILPDLSGNGNDLTNYNMAYTLESGYGDGYIQYDGIDDYSNVEWTDITAKSVLLVCEDIVNTKESPYYSRTSMVGNDRSLFGDITNGRIQKQNNYGYYNGTDLGTERYTKDFTAETGILNIYLGNTNGLKDDPTYIYNACLGAGNYYNNPPKYSCKLKVYDFLIYNRKLTDEEIAYNYKVSQQLNGIE